jgi:hypothetical protein
MKAKQRRRGGGGNRGGLAYRGLAPQTSGAVNTEKTARSTGEKWVRRRKVGVPRKSAIKRHRLPLREGPFGQEGEPMHEWRDLSHVRWGCKYHGVIVPK